MKWCKVNIDGVVRLLDEVAVAGGLIQDSEGCWRILKKCGICSVFEVEVWGAYDGRLHAWI